MAPFHLFSQCEREGWVSQVPNGDLFVESHYKCMLPHLDQLKVAGVCARARALSCFYQWLELPSSHLSCSYCYSKIRMVRRQIKIHFEGPALVRLIFWDGVL